MRHTTTKPAARAALLTGAGLLLLGGALRPASAQDQTPPPSVPAAPPGPATQPPPAPGNPPAPTQPPAAPAPPGTESPTPAAPAPAPATPPPNYHIQYNGLIDGYYLFQFNNPAGQGVITGRTYDIRHNTPTLALGELNVFQNARPHGLGFKATLDVGDEADINAFATVGQDANGNTVLIHNDAGEGRFKNIGQLYGTYSFGADGSGVDVGKFFTPFGYEVSESNGDYNYSRSVAYNYVPFYHAGARIYTPVPGVSGLTATFYLVQTVFNTPVSGVQNDNKRPGYIGQLNYTDPKGKFTLASELGLGKQKFSAVNAPGPDTKVTVNDNNFTWNFNANQLAGLDYVYRKLEPNGGFKETTNAYAVYYRQALTPKTAFALRYSGANDKFDDPAIGTLRPNEVTGTYEYKAAANFITRLEYRHDNANYEGFLDKDGALTKKNQDTLTVAGIFTF